MSSLKAQPVTRARILVVDDKAQMREVLCKFLSAEGYDATAAASAREALAQMNAAAFDVILSDIKMPGMDGSELLERVKTKTPDLIVILMTAFGSIEAAVEAIKHGAADYVSKPFALDDVLLRIKRALDARGLRARVKDLEQQVAAHEASREIIGQSAAIKRVLNIIERVAPLDDTILVTGETGTGKELVARLIHKQSGRGRHPFLAVDCSSIPESLIESELFGHEKGAFTGATEARAGLFEAAANGTLFLDEVESLSLAVQTKLLRVLQERAVRRIGARSDVAVTARIVAATNRDLTAAIEAGEFRADLYYRLAVIPVTVPPLRERCEDIAPLVAHLLARRAAHNGEAARLTPEAMRLLIAHDWRGNIRELENVISYATALGGKTIGIEDLPSTLGGAKFEVATLANSTHEFATATLDEVERRHILHTLETVNGNQVRAAKLLGIDRRTLYNKLQHSRARFFINDFQ